MPRASKVLFGLAAALYVLLFPYHPKLRSPNELSRLWQAKSLVEFGTLDVNAALRQYGFVGDLSYMDRELPDGQRARFFYPSKAPLLSFAAAPVYWVLRRFGGGGPDAVPEVPLVYWSRLWITVLPTLALLILIRRFLRAYVSAPVADGVTATYALGSLAFSYSLLFMSHQTTAVLLFASFYALWRYFRGDYGWQAAVLAGAAAGAAVAAEYTGALGVLGLVLYGVLARWKAWKELGRVAGLAFLGAAPFLLGLMAYHQACFGGPFESGYKHLADAAYQPWHLGGFMGIRVPDPRAFGLSFFGPLRGLFALSPFLLLAVPGLVVLFRRTEQELRPLFWLSAALLAGYAYFISSFSYESWGWTTGPRHLTGLVPFLLLPVAVLLERRRSGESPRDKMLLGAGAGLCLTSMVVTGLATFVNYIPDSVSNPLFGLALPLFKNGYFPPNALLFLGFPAGLAAGLLFLALGAAAALVLYRLTGPWKGAAVAVPVAVCAAFLLLLSTSTRHDDADLGAENHLRNSWLAPPGTPFVFWGPR